MNPSHQFENGGGDFNSRTFSSFENDEIDFTSPVAAGAVELTPDQDNGVDDESTLTFLAWLDENLIAMDTDDPDVTISFSGLINDAELLQLDKPTSQTESSSSEPDNSLYEVLSSITSSPIDNEPATQQLADTLSPPPQKRGRGRPPNPKKPATKTTRRVKKWELEPTTKDIRDAITAKKNRVAEKQRREKLISENVAKNEKISQLEKIIEDKNLEIIDYKEKLESMQQILANWQNQMIIGDEHLAWINSRRQFLK
ncbi:uncharacterized protein LOC118436787 [Folsomia candida]|uniref:BZIP domain-containing protein n=1 Tax=Folsomia candida TaxID=158441 RepID=A0A226DUV9_FOLCA|nr:uncharacterized protein LOC118436787 [Folsomia candida]OXA49262.1 hypothetical protein Fcan01_15429 [Folsomia candida]